MPVPVMVRDDFNRADGPIGGDWTVWSGFADIVGNTARLSSWGLATFGCGSGRAVEADIACHGTSLQYVGLVLDYADVDNNLFLKVQNNDGDEAFDKAACYYGNNATSNPFGLGFFDLTSPFTTAHMRVERVGSTVAITFSNIDGSGAVQSYACTGAPASGGIGIGIAGFTGLASLDNFAGPSTTSLLWTEDGLAMTWAITADGTFGWMQGFGTDPVWRATSFEKNVDGSAHLLWTHATAGTAMVWHLTPGGGWGSMEGFGYTGGWKATSYQRKADGSAYLLWTDGNGLADLWTITAGGGWGGSVGFDAGLGWKATSYRRNPDGTAELVWAKQSTGQAMIWTLTAGGGWGGMLGLGIGAGWLANGFERNLDGTGVLLWANPATGQAMSWALTAANIFAGMQGFGVSAGWEATKYLRP